MKWDGDGGYWVSDDRSLVDAGRVHLWLSTLSYWAQGRSREVVERSIDESLPLGLYDSGGAQAGFCRWVTDYSTFAWLADVFVRVSETLEPFTKKIVSTLPASVRRMTGTSCIGAML